MSNLRQPFQLSVFYWLHGLRYVLKQYLLDINRGRQLENDIFRVTCFHPKMEWDRIPTDPLFVSCDRATTIDTQVFFGVRSWTVGPFVGDFLDCSCSQRLDPFDIILNFQVRRHFHFVVRTTSGNNKKTNPGLQVGFQEGLGKGFPGSVYVTRHKSSLMF